MEAMQAKAISLNDLALLDVDVDQLLNKNEKTRSLSDEMRRSLHIRGRTAYAESLSSIDTDSQHSFSSHATSKSSRSNASSSISSVRSNSSSTSSRASNSKKGKVLARMSLTGIEAVAVAESKRKQAADLKKSMELNYVALKKKQQIDEQNQKQLLSNSFFNSIDDNDVKKDRQNDNKNDGREKELLPTTSNKNNNKMKSTTTTTKKQNNHPQLSSNDILKIVDMLGPTLKKTSNIRTLLDSYTLATQHYILRNIRRVKHVIEKQSLLGKRKIKQKVKNNKSTSSEQQISIKLSEWINKHIFYPRSVHLHDGGDRLFLVVFRLVMADKFGKLKSLRKIGWGKYREKLINSDDNKSSSSLSPSILKLLDGLQNKEEKDKILHEIKKIVGKRNKYSKERLKPKGNRNHYKNKKQNNTSPNNNNSSTYTVADAGNNNTNNNTTSMNGGEGRGRFSKKKRKNSLDHFVDETGEKLSVQWDKFVDHEGTVLFANELTGEVIPEKEFRNHFFSTSKDANRLQKKKQLIDGESLFSSILKNDSNSDYEVDYISNYNKDDDEMNGTGINRSISKDSSDSNNRNSFNVIDINEDARRNSDNNKSPRNTPTKSYFSLKGIRKIAKRMIKGPSSTKHKINSTSEKKYHQQQQRQYDDDGIV